MVIAGQFSASLAWIALCAEDAPDFVATAPATRRQIERAKIAAIAMPGRGACMALPLAGLAFASPRAAAVAAVCGVGAGVSGALLMLWRQAPARRGMVLRRHSQCKLVALASIGCRCAGRPTTRSPPSGALAFVGPLLLIALTLWLIRPPPRRLPTLGPRRPEILAYRR